MPKALDSLPSARVRSVSFATPLIESSRLSRSCSRRSLCFSRKGVSLTFTFFAGLGGDVGRRSRAAFGNGLAACFVVFALAPLTFFALILFAATFFPLVLDADLAAGRGLLADLRAGLRATLRATGFAAFA